MKIFLKPLTCIIFGTIFFCCPSSAESQSLKIFSLSDGTTLKGTLIGIRQQDNAYLIETETMGTVAIRPDDIITMTQEKQLGAQTQPPSAAPNELPQKLSPSAVTEVQNILMSDPDIIQSIQELMSDPEIMQLLQDPQVMQAVMTMDPNIIQANPNVQQLLEHPKFQQLIKQSGQQLMKHDQP